MKMEIKDWLIGGVAFDKDDNDIFTIGCDSYFGTPNLICSIRGWARISNITETNGEVAVDFFDSVGQFIANAINEKLEREKMENKIQSK